MRAADLTVDDLVPDRHSPAQAPRAGDIPPEVRARMAKHGELEAWQRELNVEARVLAERTRQLQKREADLAGRERAFQREVERVFGRGGPPASSQPQVEARPRSGRSPMARRQAASPPSPEHGAGHRGGLNVTGLRQSGSIYVYEPDGAGGVDPLLGSALNFTADLGDLESANDSLLGPAYEETGSMGVPMSPWSPGAGSNLSPTRGYDRFGEAAKDERYLATPTRVSDLAQSASWMQDSLRARANALLADYRAS